VQAVNEYQVRVKVEQFDRQTPLKRKPVVGTARQVSTAGQYQQ
jgi:hypothetical protein